MRSCSGAWHLTVLPNLRSIEHCPADLTWVDSGKQVSDLAAVAVAVVVSVVVARAVAAVVAVAGAAVVVVAVAVAVAAAVTVAGAMVGAGVTAMTVHSGDN